MFVGESVFKAPSNGRLWEPPGDDQYIKRSMVSCKGGTFFHDFHIRLTWNRILQCLSGLTGPANHYSVHCPVKKYTVLGHRPPPHPYLKLHHHHHYHYHTTAPALDQQPHQDQRNSNHKDDWHSGQPCQNDFLPVEGLRSPLGVLPHDIVTDVTRIPCDHEDEGKPTKDREEEDEDQSSAHLSLNLDIFFWDAFGEAWSVREFPALVQLTVGLLKFAAVFLKNGASFGFGAVGNSAVFVSEEHFEHLVAEGEDWTLFLEDVHVIVGHVHAFSNLFVSACTGQGFFEGQFKAVARW